MTKTVAAIIVAAGKSQRMGGADKQLRTIAGVPVLARTVAAFEACDDVGAIVLVLNPDNMAGAAEMGQEYGWRKVRAMIAGGERRQDSVGAGLLAVSQLDPTFEWVAVHDGARPLLTSGLISRGLAVAMESGAAIAALPATDTVKTVDGHGFIIGTPDRSNLWLAQTPQIFRVSLLIQAYETLAEIGTDDAATDCARIVELTGQPVRVYEGERNNIKITTPLDLYVAEAILKGGDWDARMLPCPTFRAGFGYDVHRLVDGRPLILGGVTVPYEKGLDGHSDADVLLHALIDAILGASGMGDIGTHFPSSNPSLLGISSVDMLTRVMSMVVEKGWRVENIDGTIVAQRPRLSPHTPLMRAAIAESLGIEEERVNIKSKTTDGLGFTGTGEGMAAYCAVMLIRNA